MKYKLHIGFVNRVDLLKEAVESSRDIGNQHIWADGVPEPEDITDVTHHNLPPISAVDCINHMIYSSWNDDVMFWMHNDGYAHPGAAKGFLEATKALHASGEKWGVFFSLYDILCAFNMEAVRDVGYWDPMFFQYTADPDYYHRLKIKGWEQRQWDPGRDGRIEHRGSMTVRSDSLFNHRVQFRERDGFDKKYYRMKWGGLPYNETFTREFEDFRPPIKEPGTE